MKYGGTIFLRDYDIISQPLLKSTCVFGPKKGVTCRPVYDNKFCFLSCIVGTCADGPIFLFKVERANKKTLAVLLLYPSFVFRTKFSLAFLPWCVFLEFLRIYRDIFTQLSPIISWHDMTCKDTDLCLCLWLGSLFPNEMYLSFEQECNWTPKNGSASATIVALATALPLGMVLTFLQCYVTGWNWSRFGLRPPDPFLCKVKLQCASCSTSCIMVWMVLLDATTSRWQLTSSSSWFWTQPKF